MSTISFLLLNLTAVTHKLCTSAKFCQKNPTNPKTNGTMKNNFKNPHKEQGIDTADLWWVVSSASIPTVWLSKDLTLCALPQSGCRWIHPSANTWIWKTFIASVVARRSCICSVTKELRREDTLTADGPSAIQRALLGLQEPKWRLNVVLFPDIAWKSSSSRKFVECKSSSCPVWCELADSAAEDSMVKKKCEDFLLFLLPCIYRRFPGSFEIRFP